MPNPSRHLSEPLDGTNSEPHITNNHAHQHSSEEAQRAEILTRKAAATTDPVERERLLRLALDCELRALDRSSDRTFRAQELLDLLGGRRRGEWEGEEGREGLGIRTEDGGGGVEEVEVAVREDEGADEEGEGDENGDESYEFLEIDAGVENQDEPPEKKITIPPAPTAPSAPKAVSPPPPQSPNLSTSITIRSKKPTGRQRHEDLPVSTETVSIEMVAYAGEEGQSSGNSTVITASPSSTTRTTTSPSSSQRSEPVSPTRRRPRKLEVRTKRKKPRKLEIRSGRSSLG